jgi:hypothetical protein
MQYHGGGSRAAHLHTSIHVSQQTPLSGACSRTAGLGRFGMRGFNGGGGATPAGC